MEPINSNRSLEIRINSVQDARSAVFHSKRVMETMTSLGLETIQFLLAEEVKNDVYPILAGAFRVKTYTSYLRTRDNNVLFSLPHYAEKQVQIVAAVPERKVIKIYPKNGKPQPEVKVAEVQAPKKRGPKKGWKTRLKEPSPDQSLDPVKT